MKLRPATMGIIPSEMSKYGRLYCLDTIPMSPKGIALNYTILKTPTKEYSWFECHSIKFTFSENKNQHYFAKIYNFNEFPNSPKRVSQVKRSESTSLPLTSKFESLLFLLI